ncbi:hypothetical protein AOLI_G00000680 [Acnodon oligacanthus]
MLAKLQIKEWPAEQREENRGRLRERSVALKAAGSRFLPRPSACATPGPQSAGPHWHRCCCSLQFSSKPHLKSRGCHGQSVSQDGALPCGKGGIRADRSEAESGREGEVCEEEVHSPRAAQREVRAVNKLFTAEETPGPHAHNLLPETAGRGRGGAKKEASKAGYVTEEALIHFPFRDHSLLSTPRPKILPPCTKNGRGKSGITFITSADLDGVTRWHDKDIMVYNFPTQQCLQAETLALN